MKSHTYAGAGVDIERGDRLVDFIRNLGSPAIAPGIGGFSGSFEVDLRSYRDPLFMSTTDGVGTKILVARELGEYGTIGVDLVAMCVNDLVVCGAHPIQFLDYIACGRIEEKLLQEVVHGIVAGCEQAECTLSGGETAELPDMYAQGEFDLAGFAVGVAERGLALPKADQIREGDLIMALPSVGIHSNGLSLARKVIPRSESALWKELLRPTKIYVREMKRLLTTGTLLAAAHITGGGLLGNLKRVIPSGLNPQLTNQWDVPEIFASIQHFGRIDADEMRRVFNMGIGIAFVVRADQRETVSAVAADGGFDTPVIGELVRG